MHEIVDEEHTATLLKTILPHRSSFIDQRGFSGSVHLLEEIEKAILTELRSALAGEGEDQDAIKRSAAILKAVDELATDTKGITAALDAAH